MDSPGDEKTTRARPNRGKFQQELHCMSRNAAQVALGPPTVVSRAILQTPLSHERLGWEAQKRRLRNSLKLPDKMAGPAPWFGFSSVSEDEY